MARASVGIVVEVVMLWMEDCDSSDMDHDLCRWYYTKLISNTPPNHHQTDDVLLLLITTPHYILIQ